MRRLLFASLLLLLLVPSVAGAHEEEKIYVLNDNGTRGREIERATVEFLALREGICREIWIQGDHVISSEIIECPVEELEGYIEQEKLRRKK